MKAYLQEVNSQANARDYLMSSMTDLPITTINSRVGTGPARPDKTGFLPV